MLLELPNARTNEHGSATFEETKDDEKNACVEVLAAIDARLLYCFYFKNTKLAKLLGEVFLHIMISFIHICSTFVNNAKTYSFLPHPK